MAPMKVVGIEQLKARLSEYIGLAKASETGAGDRTRRGRCGAGSVESAPHMTEEYLRRAASGAEAKR
jgi:hypothetical protein